MQKVAEDRGVSLAEVALAWVTARPAVTASNPQAVDYPYGELGQEQRSRRLAGGR